MVTKKNVSRHIPKRAMFLSLGEDFCAYQLDGQIVTVSYAELFNKEATA